MNIHDNTVLHSIAELDEIGFLNLLARHVTQKECFCNTTVVLDKLLALCAAPFGSTLVESKGNIPCRVGRDQAE